MTVSVSSTASMFASAGPPAASMMLTTLDGDSQESFKIAQIVELDVDQGLLYPAACCQHRGRTHGRLRDRNCAAVRDSERVVARS